MQPNLPQISQTTPSSTVTTLQPVPQGLQNSKQELEQYQLQGNAPHVCLTKPTSTVTTLQQVPQVLQNAKQDLQLAPAPNKHSTKFSQQPPHSIHLVDKQMKKMEITMNAVHGKQTLVTNGALHSVMGYVESDENISKLITTPVSSPFHKTTTPVKNSSDVNILSCPITTIPSRFPGHVLEDRLESL